MDVLGHTALLLDAAESSHKLKLKFHRHIRQSAELPPYSLVRYCLQKSRNMLTIWKPSCVSELDSHMMILLWFCCVDSTLTIRCFYSQWRCLNLFWWLFLMFESCFYLVVVEPFTFLLPDLLLIWRDKRTVELPVLRAHSLNAKTNVKPWCRLFHMI